MGGSDCHRQNRPVGVEIVFDEFEGRNNEKHDRGDDVEKQRGTIFSKSTWKGRGMARSDNDWETITVLRGLTGETD